MKRVYVFLLFVSTCWSLYPSSSNVVELTANNFQKLVTNGKEIWIVEFYAPWCGHCQSFASEYSKAADALQGVVKLGAVNADEHKSLSSQYNVRGFPTVKIFGGDKSKPEDYNGDRTAKGLIDASLKAIEKKVRGTSKSGSGQSKSSKNEDVIELTDSNFDKLVLESDDMWLVEFFAPWCGHCKNLAPHWAKAAIELKGKVKLGAVDATVYQSKASKYGVQGYPTIKFFPPGKKSLDSALDFDGGRTADDIVSWALDKLAENIPAPELIEVINEDRFKETCEQKSLCIVSVLPHILDCQSECRNAYLDTLKKLANKYKKNLWGWVWTWAGAQAELESALDIGGFGYPAMAVVNSRKMKYSLLRGSFSFDGINEFLRDLSYGRGSTAPIKDGKIGNIANVDPWDGKDGELIVEEDIDLSDVDLNEKDEL